ncbi:MAG: rhomboid family intrarane serine protease [Ferruginibacter sp.]|nr:rhomboid family intrarane serine protease [Ferruginibacter sp.]
MIPISDNNDDRTRTPIVNYLLIALNIFVFVYYQGFGSNESFLMSFSTVPAEIISGTDIRSNGLGVTPIPVYLTLFTSMFMHGGLAHIAGNMLYLWVFGDNLENRMGPVKYLAFYILCGLLASVAHVVLTVYTGRDGLVPSLGASGAISGVLGGYLMLFPKNKVRVLAFMFVITVPAVITLGLWIALQLVSGYGMLGGDEPGGVAYAAHIGGFIAGMILVRFFAPKPVAPVVEPRRWFR